MTRARVLAYSYLRPSRFAVLLASLVLCGRAQDRLEFNSCTGQIGGGVSPVRGDDNGALRNPTWTVQAGGGFATSKRFAFVANFLFFQTNVRPEALQQRMPAPGDGKARFYTAFLEPTWIAFANHRANFYVLGGFGWLRRSIKFTNPGNTLTNPGDLQAGGATSSSGAFDTGAGVNIRLKRSGARVFLEGRYMHGLARNSGTTLIPVTVGLRW